MSNEKKKPNTERRTPKESPKLNIELNDEQKEFVKTFYDYDVSFLHGDFGCGKTVTAVYCALTAFNKRQYDNVWITRPMLKNNLGALPGDIMEKLAPYTFPIQQNLEVCQGKPATDKMYAEGYLKIMPVEVAKGVTFINSVVIVDEYQDMDYVDFRTIITRLGVDSKIIFCGSEEQIDPRLGNNSCIYKTKQLENTGLVGFKTLTSNHRNPILTDIINFLEKDLK